MKVPATVLVVDDGDHWVRTVRHSLRDLQTEMFVADSVDTALREIETHAPDVIVLDLAMPSHDEGLQVLSFVREKQLQSRVIVLSSTTDKRLLERCWDLGAFAVIRKSTGDIESDLPREVSDALAGRTGG